MIEGGLSGGTNAVEECGGDFESDDGICLTEVNEPDFVGEASEDLFDGKGVDSHLEFVFGAEAVWIIDEPATGLEIDDDPASVLQFEKLVDRA